MGSHNASFTLLSENSFVLPQFSKSYDAEVHVPDDTFGSLDVYRFGSTYTRPKRVASLRLPPLGSERVEGTFRIRCLPTSVIPSSQAYLKSLPKIYDLAPLDRLLCVDVHKTPIKRVGFGQYAGTLFVPASVLLHASPNYHHAPSDQEGHQVVPWPTWAPKVAWVNLPYDLGVSEYEMFGQRTAKLLSATFSPFSRILILDFDPRRLKARRIGDIATHGEICTPGDGSRDFTGKAIFCSKEASASKKYVSVTFTAKDGHDLGYSDAVIVDDEHIVVKKTHQDEESTLLVYNF
ncbi:hypothetical protein FRC06_006672 [Ceratobasidium sp. 370]|nr:hypothetical protein FRC06_006672 [Ceratobasidium sp. 370]